MFNYRYASILVLMVIGVSYLKAQGQQIGISSGALDYSSWDYPTEINSTHSFSAPLDIYAPKFSSGFDDKAIRIKKPKKNSWFGSNHHWDRRSTHHVNFYIGLTNFLQDGDIPNSDELYSVEPLSWYVAINFDNTTKAIGPLFIDWGAGVSMQDFSFENTRARIVKGDNSITFTEDMDITGRKSKLNMMHLNVHLIPTFHFGKYNNFRFGAGIYAGYRVSSFAKYKYKDADGEKQKDKIKDNLFISPFKYGFRTVIGWDSFDLFINYDVTELFEDDKTAPRLNPVTFGIVF